MIKHVTGWQYVLTGVFSWGEEGLTIDNKKCTSCGKCEKACMASAIKVAKNVEEYQKIKKEIEEDPRSINDLLVDRYGATPIDVAMMGNKDEIEIKMQAKRPMIIELYNEDSIMCLLKSIPIKEIADTFDKDTRYRKIEVEGQELLEKYGIKELPALLFFRDGKFVKKYEGYVEVENKEELINFIKNKKG